jgi:hypothetical protein
MFSFKILKLKKWVLNFDFQIIIIFFKLLILNQDIYFLNQIINLSLKISKKCSSPFLLITILKT